MEEKNEIIQLRVDSDLKKRFFELSEKQGQSPSVHLRSLMRQALERDDTKITDLEDSTRSIHVILLEVLSYLHRRSLLLDNDSQWDLYKDSFLPEYLVELVDDTLRDAGVSGDDYWQRHWEEIDKNWYTKFRENPPIMATYLRREFMDELRKEIKQQHRKTNQPKQRTAHKRSAVRAKKPAVPRPSKP